MRDHDVQEICQAIKEKMQFLEFSFVATTKPLRFDLFQRWLSERKHGDLSYLEKSAAARADLRNVSEFAKSVFVVAEDYSHFESPTALKVARYARGNDYHHEFRAKLKRACDELQNYFPEEAFFPATDAFPILERDFASQAGFGWIGKNGCAITRSHGSFFFLGEIISSLAGEAQVGVLPPLDFCGNCNRCVAACPTGAIENPRVLNASKCISFWNIESRQIPPPELRNQMGDQFFGCDICQNVCPWNRKKIVSAEERSREEQITELRFYLTASGKQIERKTAGTPLRRAGPFGLRRNAILVAGNSGYSELTDEIGKLAKFPKLIPLIAWASARLHQTGVTREQPSIPRY